MQSPPAVLSLVPGKALVLFLVCLEQGPLACLPVAPQRFLEGLRAATALCGFSALQRVETPLEELLPWTGNV